MKILLGITGSNSVHLGLKILETLEQEVELFCVITKDIKKSFETENKQNLSQIYKKFNQCVSLNDEDLNTGVSGDSLGIDETIIAPCSISALAKIHAGFCDTLLARACAVALKERKKLILAVRELPFSMLNLERMAGLSLIRVIITPSIYASYSKIRNLGDLENFIIGKWLDLLEIDHNLYEGRG